MKNEIIASVSAFIGGLLTLLITITDAFMDARDNMLLVSLVFFFVTACGYGIGRLSSFILEDKPKKKKGKKKDTFHPDDEGGFIGDGRF